MSVDLTGEKKLQGRKRHIIVDTEGNLLKVVVHRADIHDSTGAYYVLEDIDECYPQLELLWADQGYRGELVEYMQERYEITLDIVAKPADQTGFVVLPRRWVVERTFAWLGRYRRLSKDYERRVEYSESWVYIASIARLLQNLHPNETQDRPYFRKSKKDTADETPTLVDIE